MSPPGDPKNPSNAPPAGGYGAAGPGAGFGPAPPPTAPKRGMGGAAVAGLVVGGIVVAMVGTLAVLAIFGVRKYIGASKQAEVKNSLGQIAKAAVVAYERERPAEGSPERAFVERRLCASASRPVPLDPSQIRGRKYMSSRDDWDVDKERDAGFACLRFEMSAPQYYQYRYEATATTFVIGGRGDLDGDGTLSDFRLGGQIRDTRILIAPQILETDPEE